MDGDCAFSFLSMYFLRSARKRPLPRFRRQYNTLLLETNIVGIGVPLASHCPDEINHLWEQYASIVLETCSNVMELSELINENDFDDEPPTLTPSFQFSHWYLIQKPDQMLSRSLVHRND
ncbi:hypothetical protein EVAR_79151_1 [Eumeta japonica]|uniref:Uncharacterized protein n=1 Tax=Eumeta variegata TaxID=151549 RepID=A0A4C1UUD3_EUMVA|nr:hypothetical protein EVAR_79151_1 [Eumeta japonica]